MAPKSYSKSFREEFVDACLRSKGETTIVEQCDRFGISRQAAYEWLARYEAEGVKGLESRSSAPLTVPHAIDKQTVELITQARIANPTWGPKKLKTNIEEAVRVRIDLPALSTIGDILKRAGLIPAKRRRPPRSFYVGPLRDALAPNDVWTTDFKGHFRMRDRRICYPLTLCDSYSRYLLRCDAYTSASSEARRSFERAFIDFGLPRSIRSDNGAPFSSPSVGGLSSLSVWWIRLGIVPERIAPGSPWQNGRHERMHRTLKAETAEPAQANRKQQQKAFDSFREEYNNDRPHEALGQKPPRAFFVHSKRSFPLRLPELEYPANFQLRRVSDNGLISCAGKRVFISNLLKNEIVGLKQTKEAVSELYFGPILLGAIDHTAREPAVKPPKRRRRRR